MTDAEPGQPVSSRRRFLRWAGAVGVVGTAGCGGSDPSETPTSAATQTPTQTPTATETATKTPTATLKTEYSYEPIMGTWTGVTDPTDATLHDFAKVEIMEERAAPGEEIGIFQLLFEEDGAVLCWKSLVAERSDPPTYLVDIGETSTPTDRGPCITHDRHRFEHITDDSLQVYVQYHNSEYWRETVRLEREPD